MALPSCTDWWRNLPAATKQQYEQASNYYNQVYADHMALGACDTNITFPHVYQGVYGHMRQDKCKALKEVAYCMVS